MRCCFYPVQGSDPLQAWTGPSFAQCVTRLYSHAGETCPIQCIHFLWKLRRFEMDTDFLTDCLGLHHREHAEWPHHRLVLQLFRVCDWVLQRGVRSADLISSRTRTCPQAWTWGLNGTWRELKRSPWIAVMQNSCSFRCIHLAEVSRSSRCQQRLRNCNFPQTVRLPTSQWSHKCTAIFSHTEHLLCTISTQTGVFCVSAVCLCILQVLAYVYIVFAYFVYIIHCRARQELQCGFACDNGAKDNLIPKTLCRWKLFEQPANNSTSVPSGPSLPSCVLQKSLKQEGLYCRRWPCGDPDPARISFTV